MTIAGWEVIEGDCLEELAKLSAGSVDAIVTDPPYGIDFKHARWDGRDIATTAASLTRERLSSPEAFQAYCRAWAAACRRVLKPGAHLLAFGSSRTAHRLAAGLEDAGLELRDTLMWLYGTGLPKSRRLPGGRATTLKPAYEPILLARRPPVQSITRTIERHGTGALNTDACRAHGRHPANIICSHEPGCQSDRCEPGCAVAVLDAAAAHHRSPSAARSPASRLLYCPKVSRRERDAGCEHLPHRRLDLFPNAQDAGAPAPARNPHPTVKPLALMRWLVRLATPEDGLILDPFCGSGSTGAAAALERRRFLGIELDPDYALIARARIAHWSATSEQEPNAVPFARTA
jgi:DNA modification methylase